MVESARLLSGYTVYSCIEGSNPSLSATIIISCAKYMPSMNRVALEYLALSACGGGYLESTRATAIMMRFFDWPGMLDLRMAPGICEAVVSH